MSSFTTKDSRPFYDMVKICFITIKNVNIFTIYETLFEKVITILPITYQNEMPGKNRKGLVYLKEVSRYINYMQAI